MAPTRIKIKNRELAYQKQLTQQLLRDVHRQFAGHMARKSDIVDDLSIRLEQSLKVTYGLQKQTRNLQSKLSSTQAELTSVKQELELLKTKEQQRKGLPQLINSAVVAAPFVATTAVATATVASVAVPLGCAAVLANELTKVR